LSSRNAGLLTAVLLLTNQRAYRLRDDGFVQAAQVIKPIKDSRRSGALQASTYELPLTKIRQPPRSFLRAKHQFWLVDIKARSGRNEEQFCSFVDVCSQGWEGLMPRTMARLAIVTTALCSIVLISFPSFPSTLGIVSKPQLVDRALKSDRLTNVPAPAKNGHKSQPSLVRAEKRVPMGCDRTFSSMSSRQFSTIFGRCLV
jgi:hypothetical protein